MLALCYFLSGMVVAWVYGLGAEPGIDQKMLMESEGGRNLMRLLHGISNAITFGGAAILWSGYTEGLRGIVLNTRPVSYKWYAMGALCMAVALPFVSGLAIPIESIPDTFQSLKDWYQTREQSSNEMILAYMKDLGVSGFLLNLLVIAVVPAVAEEFFFRGFFMGSLLKIFPRHIAVWGSAVFFSLIHFSITGFLARCVLGAILGYFFLWTGNLRMSILGHFIHNSLTLVFVVLEVNGLLPGNFAKADSLFPWYIVVVSGICTLGLLSIFERNFRQKRIYGPNE
jgi:uncharacterized protein